MQASTPAMSTKRVRAETVTNGRDIFNEALDTSARSLVQDPNDMTTAPGHQPGGLEEPETQSVPIPVQWEEPPRVPIGELPGLNLYSTQSVVGHSEGEDDSLLTPLTPLWNIFPPSQPGNGSATTNRLLYNQYKLPDEPTEKLKVLRPDFRSQPLIAEREATPDEVRGVVRMVSEQLLRTFPRVGSPYNTDKEALDAEHALTTPWAFYHTLFRPQLVQSLNRATSDTGKPDSISGFWQPSKWTALWALCEEQEYPQRQKFWQSLYNTFVSMVNSPQHGGATSVRAAVQSAKARQSTLKQFRLAGQMAAAKAHYVPCHKASMSNNDKRFIAESEDIKRLAIDSGALNSSEILLVDETWQRIVKPPPEAGLQAVILYDAASVKGNIIKQGNIIGGALYNADMLTSQASEVSQQMLALEMAQLVQHLQ
ncbi:unnamed protein product [Peniophora sp. CBMAI 1063]|nr:unnamed protein product [Peniophora sp. CBMAI 1063]